MTDSARLTADDVRCYLSEDERTLVTDEQIERVIAAIKSPSPLYVCSAIRHALEAIRR